MVKSVVRQFNWQPYVIETLFLDDVDYNGLVYWYNDVIELNKTETK